MSDGKETCKIKEKMEALEKQLKPYQTAIDVNLDEMYGRTVAEMTLQQTKRDQIIASYLTVLSLTTSLALTSEHISEAVRGGFFLAAGIIGYLLAQIIIRYRVYKEAYWLCCQSISVLFGYKKEALNKQVIQDVYRATMLKKGKSYAKEISVGKNEDGEEITELIFSKWKYVKKSWFSAETIYLFIQALISAAVTALGVGFLSEGMPWAQWRWWIAVAVGALVALKLVWKYFAQCIGVYQWLIDGKDASFNNAFGKAWLLHFYH